MESCYNYSGQAQLRGDPDRRAVLSSDNSCLEKMFSMSEISFGAIVAYCDLLCHAYQWDIYLIALLFFNVIIMLQMQTIVKFCWNGAHLFQIMRTCKQINQSFSYKVKGPQCLSPDLQSFSHPTPGLDSKSDQLVLS